MNLIKLINSTTDQKNCIVRIIESIQLKCILKMQLKKFQNWK